MTDRPMYYSRSGEPLPLLEWAQAFESIDKRRVAETQIGEVWVSTVFLGLDHNWGDGPPLIFETMVFGGDDDGYQARYSTEAAALSGHDRVVAALMNGEHP